MNVIVNLDGNKTINPNYEPTPRNLVQVKDFYLDLMAKQEIKGFVIRYDNGDVFAMGEVL